MQAILLACINNVISSGGEMHAHDVLERICSGMAANTGCQVAHVAELPAKAAQYASPDPPRCDQLSSALSAIGVSQLYTHQVEALGLARQGRDLVVVTATSSGKTLCYNVPIFEAMLADREARALYLYPINALINDQLKTLFRMNLSLGRQAVGIDRYTGSVTTARRAEIRARQPNILLTNPEMLHLSLLQWHHLWETFWSKLAFVVVDEIHTYRGVFGTNMAYLFRRLLRIARHYGARPQFICCSATIANPAELARKLTSREFSVIDRDGAATGEKRFVLWNPPLSDGDKTYTRRSYAQESVDLLHQCLSNDLNTIVFTRARKLTEQMLRMSHGLSPASDANDAPAVTDQIASYRAGYLAQERETIESQLQSGELRGVITTNALELGIDIGGLDSAVIAGYPGTIMSTWQQAGRAGRAGRDALVFLVASQNPLDQYYISHPDRFFAEPHEHAVVDLANPFILLRHLLCAAKELPWSDGEAVSAPADMRYCLEQLEASGLLSCQQVDEQSHLGYDEERKGIHMQVSLRSAGQETYRILDQDRNQIGTIQPPNVFRETHPGAIYQHSDGDYRVVALNRYQRTVLVRPEDTPHYTRSQSSSHLTVEAPFASRELGREGARCTVALGDALVTETIHGYQELDLASNEMVRRVNLDYPLQMRLHTTSLWLALPNDVTSFWDGSTPAEQQAALAEGLHALQHLLTGLLPLLVMCDRRDIAGYDDVAHPALPGPGVFLYDAYEGGIGLAEAAYGQIEDVLQLAHDTVQRCPCHEGCPACIQFSGCRRGNEGLNKQAALRLLAYLCQILGSSSPSHATASRRSASAGQHSDLSLKRALAEIDEMTRRAQLQDHIGQNEADPRPVVQQFRENDWVQHTLYGRGIVLASQIEDGTEWVSVRFVKRGRQKRFDAGQGQLRKAD